MDCAMNGFAKHRDRLVDHHPVQILANEYSLLMRTAARSVLLVPCSAPDPTPHAAAATETIATVGTIGGGGPAAGVCTEAASSGATFSTTCAFHALPTSPQRIGAFPFAT